MKIIARIGLMRWIFTAFFLLSVSISTYYAEAADTVTVTFYHTSDIHENSANLPQIARLVREQKEKDSNVLFLDCGDRFNKGDLAPLKTRGEAMSAMVQAMSYDALIPGGHDITFGSKRFLILFGFMVLLSGLAAYQGVDFIKDNTESTFLYIFSGSQMSFSFIQIMVMFGPILGMAIGFDSVNKERSSGTLSMLLGQPIFRDSVINGKFLAGASSLAALGIGTIAITVGLAIPMLGYGPSGSEVFKIVTLALLTVLYLLFWLSLGMLFSVITKKTSTSILASIATWMFFSIVLTIWLTQ